MTQSDSTEHDKGVDAQLFAPIVEPTLGQIEARHAQGLQVGHHNIMVNNFLTHLPLETEIPLPTTPDSCGYDPAPCSLTRVPRTALEEQILLKTEPPGWEYMYYAACVLRKREAIAVKWHSHQYNYARRTGEWLDLQSAIELLSFAFKEVLGIIRNLMTSLNSDMLETAFGKLGEPGNRAAIEYAATYLIDSAEQLLDWSARLRGATVPDIIKRGFELAANLTTQPLGEIYAFTQQLIAEGDRIPGVWNGTIEKPMRVTLVLELTTDSKAIKEFNREMARIKRKL